MKILITGGKGLLGRNLSEKLSEHEVYALSRKSLDITDRDSSIKKFREIKPQITIHCAAFTDVDGCGENREKAYLVNALGSANIAAACFESGSIMVYISTDFIFDGKKRKPYRETDLPGPLNIYGETKLMGEYFVSHLLNRFMIVRTSRVFGKNGQNFASTLPLLLAESGKELILATNLVNSPTYVQTLAGAIAFLLKKDFCGIVNVCNKGSCSWYEYGIEAERILGIKAAKITPARFKDFKKSGTADRPEYSALNTELLESLGFPLPEWTSSLKEYLMQKR